MSYKHERGMVLLPCVFHAPCTGEAVPVEDKVRQGYSLHVLYSRVFSIACRWDRDVIFDIK